MINQLFTKNPDREIILDILDAFGYQNFNNIDQPFNKKDLDKRKTIDKMQRLRPKLEEYYIPCKVEKYLTDMNEKKLITVLRQIGKIFEYNVVSNEKYLNSHKVLQYSLENNGINDDYINHNLKIIQF